MVLNAANVDAQSIVQFLAANWHDPELVAKTATAYVLTVSDILDAYAQINPGFQTDQHVKTVVDYLLQNNIPAVGGYIRPIGSMGPGQVTLRQFNPAYPSVVTILPDAQQPSAMSVISAVPAIKALGQPATPDIMPLPNPSKIPTWMWAAGGYLALKLLF